MKTKKMLFVRIVRWATAVVIALAVLFGSIPGSRAAETGDGVAGVAATSEEKPARTRPPYVGVWGIWGAENLNAANKPWLKGTMVTRTWAQLEPANNRFDFSSLDKGLNLAVDNGYQYLMIKTTF